MRKIRCAFLSVFLIAICATTVNAQTVAASTNPASEEIPGLLPPDRNNVFSLVVQADGKIVIAGTARVGKANVIALARYQPDGTPDRFFGNSGIVNTPIGTVADGGTAIASLPDGKILVAGYTLNANLDFAMIRYNEDGSIDRSFGADGITVSAVGTGDDVVRAIAIQDDNKILLAGNTAEGNVKKISIVRFNEDGSPDNSFGVDGAAVTAFDNEPVEAYTVTSANGSIVVAGGRKMRGAAGYNFLVARYSIDGRADKGFGNEGVVSTDINSSMDVAEAVMIQPDGKIVVSGISQLPAGSETFAIIRYNTDGSFDNSFGTNGKVISNINKSYNSQPSITFRPNGDVVVGRLASTGVPFPRIAFTRYLPNGSADKSFGTEGIWISDLQSQSKAVTPAEGRALTGTTVNGGPLSDFSRTRYLTQLVTGIIDFNSHPQVAFIYPYQFAGRNPLQYELATEETISVYLINSSGKVVKTFADKEKKGKGLQSQLLDLSDDLEPGSYTLVLSSAKGNVEVKLPNLSR